MDEVDLLYSLERLPTGNVSDAMSKLRIPSGVIENLCPLSLTQKRVCGKAVTIQQRRKAGPQKGVVKQRQVITTMTQPGDTVVIDADGCMSVATAGGLLALCAQLRGVKGMVINGCLRDLEDIVAMEFPVHLLGGSPAASGEALETAGINVPLAIGGVRINPGDFILQDATGCVVIPANDAERVLMTAQVICQQEEACESLLRQGLDFAAARERGIALHPLKF